MPSARRISKAWPAPSPARARVGGCVQHLPAREVDAHWLFGAFDWSAALQCRQDELGVRHRDRGFACRKCGLGQAGIDLHRLIREVAFEITLPRGAQGVAGGHPVLQCQMRLADDALRRRFTPAAARRSEHRQGMARVLQRIGRFVEVQRDHQLPLLWDCDFMLCDAAPGDAQRYALCEVNVNSVSPFPPSSIAPLVEAVRAQLGAGAANAVSGPG